MQTINSLSEFHRLLSMPPPLHPLVSVVLVSEIHAVNSDLWRHFSTDFYTISLKNNIQSKVKYGQQYYDFDKGTMTFTAPKQVQSIEVDKTNAFNETIGTGYVLIFHADFLKKHPLQSTIRNYGFFSYSLNEALHLSQQEEQNIVDVFQKIEKEYQHIDKHTQDIMLSQIDLLLTYCNRFYERQFITRKTVNNDLLSKMENLLSDYFNTSETLKRGLPTVEYLANQLNYSANYLSDMLRLLTGQNAQQHIHEKLIEKAKEKLLTTNLSVSEIAYELGFERSQSFNRLFKKKTEMSPLKYRQSFD
ncbi:helix-turn-helix domain-containing protein [Leeuwenhoekiella marinoflava]|uniref:Helix-turn-helix protein n=2 Tax=Leeuwenhoekiella marinoflava TaxID=988 RepID=A0A4V1KSN3_9FLAO|nr:helix-turn-helix transcriptional regulator [Leeuwenhoekiella marinoflava]RXG32338.1 helix-turn-helix protein [Leeuwenhoekiella marinoflava]SHE78609.1 transcriptional regulator, AraC family [Leeuwenhoekiella marinoflava DSM 3653]